MKEQLPGILAKTERAAYNSYLITIKEAQNPHSESRIHDRLQKYMKAHKKALSSATQ